MGNIINSTKTSKHVLICGLDRAGKTTLFKLLTYSSPKDKNDQNQIKFESSIPKDEATLGFNFEYSDRDQANSIGFWDLGGKDTIRAIWQSFYKNIQYRGLIFVVNANDEDERINQARMELQKLMNEEELRSAVLYVVFNDVEKNEDDEDEDEDKEQRINEDPGVRNNILEERIGFNSIHPSVIKQSILINLKNVQNEVKIVGNVKDKIDLYEKILLIKSWLIKQMEVD